MPDPAPAGAGSPDIEMEPGVIPVGVDAEAATVGNLKILKIPLHNSNLKGEGFAVIDMKIYGIAEVVVRFGCVTGKIVCTMNDKGCSPLVPDGIKDENKKTVDP